MHADAESRVTHAESRATHTESHVTYCERCGSPALTSLRRSVDIDDFLLDTETTGHAGGQSYGTYETYEQQDAASQHATLTGHAGGQSYGTYETYEQQDAASQHETLHDAASVQPVSLSQLPIPERMWPDVLSPRPRNTVSLSDLPLPADARSPERKVRSPASPSQPPVRDPLRATLARAGTLLLLLATPLLLCLASSGGAAFPCVLDLFSHNAPVPPRLEPPEAHHHRAPPPLPPLQLPPPLVAAHHAPPPHFVLPPPAPPPPHFVLPPPAPPPAPHSVGWWMEQIMDVGGAYHCPDLAGISPTCNQCVRGAGGLSLLPPSTQCGMCGRDMTKESCGACWDSLPQIFTGPVAASNGKEMLIKSKCAIHGHNWGAAGETYCVHPQQYGSKEQMVMMARVRDRGTHVGVGGSTWRDTVLETVGLCQHLCRRWAFKLGGDQICCTIRDGMDYPDLYNRPDLAQRFGYGDDHMCTAIAGLEHLGFYKGQRYPCADMHGKNPLIAEGCWAVKNGWAMTRPQGHNPYNTDQTMVDGKLANPGLSRATTCEGLGAAYDSSGDIIAIKKGWPADKAGMRSGMRITAIETGDPEAPLAELRQAPKWVNVTDPALAVINLNVDRTPQGSIGATFRGLQLDTIDPRFKGGIYEAAKEGYPMKWPAKATGAPGSLYQTVNGGEGWPAFRRGASPGWTILKVNNVAVTRQWDIEREILRAPRQVAFPITVRVTVQSLIDRYLSACTPDKKLGVAGIAADQTHRIPAFRGFNASNIPHVDNTGFKIRVSTGTALPIQGVNGGAQVGGNWVTEASGIIKLPGPNGRGSKYYPLGESAPCGACIRGMPGLQTFQECAQGMCDWSPKAKLDEDIGKDAKALRTVPDVHSWFDCKKACCVDDGCASVLWNSDALTCDLYEQPHNAYTRSASVHASFAQGIRQVVNDPKDAPDTACMLHGCVSDKVCNWTSKKLGVTKARVLETRKNVVSIEECQTECCTYGARCKAVTWSPKATGEPHSLECALHSQFYDDTQRGAFTALSEWDGSSDPRGRSTGFSSNKWSSPLNPTCKACVDNMDAARIDGECSKCRQQGLQPHCHACWTAFSDAGADCNTCWPQISPYLSHLWGTGGPEAATAARPHATSLV